MNKILVVDDEKNIVKALSEYLEYYGFLVDIASDGMKAYDLVEKTDYDCIILDIMMPNLNGYETTKAIRKIKQTPIIMISAKGEYDDKISGFNLGVDDYLVKPFYLPEVLARIKAVMRRTNGDENICQVDNIRIDLNSHKIFVDDAEVKTTNKEYKLLLLFLKNKNTLLTRDKIQDDVWGWDYENEGRTIDVHINMLRAHLGKYGKKIKTIRGLGYKFEN